MNPGSSGPSGRSAASDVAETDGNGRATPASGGELTLDPAIPGEWSAFRELAHRMVDDTLDHLATLRDRPAWSPMPGGVRDALKESLPRRGVGAERVYRDFVDRVLPYPNGNQHPRFS